MHADLGDGRLNRRLGKVCNDLGRSLGSSIPQAMQDRSSMKAAYGFFKHEKVGVDKLLHAHVGVHQAGRAGVCRQTLLMPQDTTELDYTGKRPAKEFGPLNYVRKRGCLLHTSMIVSASGVPIGLFKQSSVVRRDADFGKRHNRKREPIGDKESYRWLEHFQACQDYFSPFPNIEVFNICDREGDIFELFAARKASNVHLIVRSQYNRKLPGAAREKLHDKVAASTPKATYKIKVTDRRTCKRRKAVVRLRYLPVDVGLSRPDQWQKHLGPVRLWAVQVAEINPPKGTKPVKWTLLTTKEVASVPDAKTIVRYYELRWVVERFFYILKVGAGVEQLQLTTAKRVLNAVAAYSICAVNLMRVNYLARQHPDWEIARIGVAEWEHEALYRYAGANIDGRIRFNPKDPPTIREFVTTIGRLGGFTNFNKQPFPGLKTFWRGMRAYQIILKTFQSLMSMN